MSNAKKYTFLRPGVRHALNLQCEEFNYPALPSLIGSIAERKWFRPDTQDVPAQRLEREVKEPGSQVVLRDEVLRKLEELSTELGFDSVRDLLEDFATGIWELNEE